MKNGECQIDVKIGGSALTDLGYSDNMTLTDENLENLQDFLNKFATNSGKVGLKMNVAKTKSMINR